MHRLRELREYDGLTYFSAAQRAGLLLRPVVGHTGAATWGRQLHWDPDPDHYPLDVQRLQFIGQIAARLAAADGELEREYARALDSMLLPVSAPEEAASARCDGRARPRAR